MDIIAKDITGKRVRVIESFDNVARTNEGHQHTTKLFMRGRSLHDMGYREGGRSIKVGTSLSDFEASHPRDEAGRFTDK